MENHQDDEREGSSVAWKIFKFCGLSIGAYLTFTVYLPWIIDFLF